MGRISDERGFTLIELMVVILMIGVLASIGLEYVPKAIDKTRINSDIAQARRLREAWDVYYTRNGSGPSTYTDLINGDYIGRVTSAQKISGNPVQLTDANLQTNGVFWMDLLSGRIVVKDVNSGSDVWDSNS